MFLIRIRECEGEKVRPMNYTTISMHLSIVCWFSRAKRYQEKIRVYATTDYESSPALREKVLTRETRLLVNAQCVPNEQN